MGHRHCERLELEGGEIKRAKLAPKLCLTVSEGSWDGGRRGGGEKGVGLWSANSG